MARKSNKLLRERYDVIVIGSGIGGLCAASLLARAARSVLVLEQHDRPGGYAHGFRRKRYHFDSGVHLTSGCGPHGYDGGQVLYKILTALGVDHEIEFIPVDPLARAVYPGFDIILPASVEGLTTTLAERFPEQEEGLRRLIETCLQLAEEAARADDVMTCGDPVQIRQQLPTLLRYRRATLSEALNRFLGDPKLQAVFTTLWPFLGLPPSKLSFLAWSTMFAGYTADGACYCKGSFQNLANALVSGLKRWGGEICFGARVDTIEIKEGRVHGVRLADKRSIDARTVVSNVDMHQTVYGLIGEDRFAKAFLRRFRRMQPSLSIFAVYIATDLDLTRMGLAHESFFYSSCDHDKNFADSQAGTIGWLSATVPTLADPSLAPKNQHIVMLTTLMPYHIEGSWKSAKTGTIDTMLRFADRFIPGLSDHILFLDGGTPMTMQRYTCNHDGAAYGWATSPDQTGPLRLPNKSPIDGLFWTGHWTSPGCGVYGVSVAGVQAVQQILGMPNRQAFWERINQSR